MNTILKEVRTTYEINKSEFITTLIPVKTIEEAKNFFAKVKAEFNDATHNITAYTIGKTGEAGHYNDDGEPSGTAGLPVLDVFRKNNITNFACVVTRYFGGIKLGAGGLVRAYSSAASLALKEAIVVPIIEYSKLVITFDYTYLDIIENKLRQYKISNREFNTKVTLIVELPKNDLSLITNILINLTNNMIIIRVLDNES